MPLPSATARPPLSAVRAWAYLGINLLATPGLGSVMGGRKGAGRGQLFFSVTGFCLIVGWIIQLSIGLSEAEISGTDATPIPAWWWQYGALAFGIGWLWSLITSVSMLIESKNSGGNSPARVPPKLVDVSKRVPPKL